MEHPGTSISEGSKGLHLDTMFSTERRMKQKKTRDTGIRRYCSLYLAVCVSDILIIFNTYSFSADQQLHSSQQHYVTFTLPVLFIF